MKFELNEDVIKAMTAQVKSIVDDILTDILHPEFGTAYDESRNLERRAHELEVDLLATRGEREYYKSRVDALNTEIDILNAEVERLKESLNKAVKSSENSEEVTEAPAPWSYITLVDRDGDRWSQRTTINGHKWHCDTVDFVQPLSFNDLKETYGPLYLPPFRTK